MKHRPILGILVMLLSAMPVAATAQSSDDDARDLQHDVIDGCGLKPWEFSVRIESGGAIIPQLSPTMVPARRKCVLKMLDNYRRSQGGQ